MASTTAATSLMPTGYTFMNEDLFISVKAERITEDLLTKAENRNPDNFGMYIYNDFYAYGLLDLVDKTLSSLHSKILKKKWDECMVTVEALTVFNDLESSWPMCDDGDRTERTNKAYGACLVNILRALKKEDRLDVTNFPSLETILKKAADWGHAMSKMGGVGSDYHLVCKAIGWRLFHDKSEQVVAAETARLEEWIHNQNPETQAIIRDNLKEAEEESDGKPWYDGGDKYDEDDKDPDFTLSRVWKEYKEYLQGCPTKPQRGPSNWDISKWTAAQKKEFSFSAGDDDSD